jgi:acetyltransferase
MARPGSVAFISQSGALCTAVLDWSLREMVGFSAFLSIGSMIDVGWGDLIDHLGNDPRTKSIVIYMESIGDARAFLSAAREVALAKPIIVIKAGRTAQAAQAAASHTGTMAGSDDVLDAAFRRCGVLRVNRIADLFYMADVLGKQPRPRGPRLTILTNAGGPGVLATDALIAEGGELTELSTETIEALNNVLPPHWSHQNPVDILGDAGPERYSKAVEIVAKDPNSDGLLVILTPQGMTSPLEIAQRLTSYAKLNHKPLLASWMGGNDVAAAASVLNHANIPTFPFPDTAAQAFHYMWSYSENLRSLYETPMQTVDPGEYDRELAARTLESARAAGRTLLTEVESKQLLAAYGIPTVETRVAASVEQAVESAAAIGYPVVLKLHSETITHKTEVGGVRLNLGDGDAVQRAFPAIASSVNEKAGPGHFQGVTVQPMIPQGGYEVILGSSLDPQFGPVLLFGSGGQLVEVYRDRALALPPLNSTLARRMMERTRIFKALQGVRGRKPVHLAALEQIVARFSQLVVEQPWIKEIDINPLLASPERLIALDARIILHPADTPFENLPRPAIRPYPSQYARPWTLKNGDPVLIRPIRPEDEPLMVRFHETLSERTVYFRYFHMLNLSQRVSHERLTRICFIDYDREMALVAERRNTETGEAEILGVGRLRRLRATNDAEFAVIVNDQLQGQGLGKELVLRLIEVGRAEKLSRIVGDILPENVAMQRVAQKCGFRLRHNMDDDVVSTELVL